MHGAELTLAVSMAAGVASLAIARHINVPGIVLLLAAGVLCGPDVLGFVQPNTLGEALPSLVSFAVAIILFEGGLHLNLRELRHQASALQKLVTLGVVVAGVGGTVAARLFMGWSWQLSALFGAVVVVTGPTVVTPLLRRIRVQRNISTLLEAEGIFNDAVGATLSVIALEVALAPSMSSIGLGLAHLFLRLALGLAVGLVSGALMSLLLRWKRVIPAGLENLVVLTLALAIFHGSNALQPESGIMAVIVAGVVVGNRESYALKSLVSFKEQLTMLFIATLFVLLSADVRIAQIVGLGVPGILTVLAVSWVVRPLSVVASTTGNGLSWREKAYLSWLAPRGIVAAAVASLFALELQRKGIEGGLELRALVFLTIAITVLMAGTTGGLMARALRLKRPAASGYMILGANPLGIALAKRLHTAGVEVELLDPDAARCEAARQAGLSARLLPAFDEAALEAVGADDHEGCVLVTTNEHVNLLCAQALRELSGRVKLFVGLETQDTGITAAMVEQIDAQVLFGHARNLARWREAAGAQQLVYEVWRPLRRIGKGTTLPSLAGQPLAMIAQDRRTARPYGNKSNGTPALFALHKDTHAADRDTLATLGWARVSRDMDATTEPPPAPVPTTA